MGVRRGARSRNPHRFNPARKSDVVEALAEKGFTLKTRKRNKGEWNEIRAFYAVSGDREIDLAESVGPGERPDWEYLLSAATKLKEEK